MTNNIYCRTTSDGTLQVALSSKNITYKLYEYGVIDTIPDICYDGHFVDAHNIEKIDKKVFNILYL